jgi:hypothetical protein
MREVIRDVARKVQKTGQPHQPQHAGIRAQEGQARRHDQSSVDAHHPHHLPAF